MSASLHLKSSEYEYPSMHIYYIYSIYSLWKGEMAFSWNAHPFYRFYSLVMRHAIVEGSFDDSSRGCAT